MPSKKPRKSSRSTKARSADIHRLYEQSVQDPPTDIKFIDRTFKKRNGRAPDSLREDFCGTALMCADWVKKGPSRRAVGLDLDRPTLDWATEHNISPLGEAAERTTLLEKDVIEGAGQKFDVVAAFNFSYCTFKDRGTFVDYCRGAHSELEEGGAFVLDIHGGLELTAAVEEETEHDEFSYVWDQEPYDAINGTAIRYIHFRFPDGSKIKRAFTYDWRLWELPEMRDVLHDAGFKDVDVFWEGADAEGDGNGIFKRVTKAEQEESWIAYVVGWR